MKKINIKNVCTDICENIYDELVLLQSLIAAIHQTCLNLELNSIYYENSKDYIKKLSEERNGYINLSSLAKERLIKLESLNTKLEDKFTLK